LAALAASGDIRLENDRLIAVIDVLNAAALYDDRPRLVAAVFRGRSICGRRSRS
jgi:hypothetical protein